MNTAYLDYLDSPEWWTIRHHTLHRAGYRCERCGSCGPLEVHHRTYRHLGNEAESELEALCTTCHRNEHLPKNRRKLELEQLGQMRLFDRWGNPIAIDVAA